MIQPIYYGKKVAMAPSAKASKQEQQEELDRQKAEFFARGGKMIVAPPLVIIPRGAHTRLLDPTESPELWRPLPGYPWYQVNAAGLIWSQVRGGSFISPQGSNKKIPLRNEQGGAVRKTPQEWAVLAGWV